MHFVNGGVIVMNEETHVDNQSNWLLSFLSVLGGMAVWFLFLYIAIKEAQSINPLAWHKAYLFCVLYVSAINIFIVLGYLGSQGKLPLDKYISWAENNFFQPNKYADKKIFEVFLATIQMSQPLGCSFCLQSTRIGIGKGIVPSQIFSL